MIRETSDSRSHLRPEHWQSRVGFFLQQRAAVRAGEIAEWLGVEEALVRHCLAAFEQTGAVEVLRPVGRQSNVPPDLDYYRWRQSEDQHFLWQAELRRRRPATLRDLRAAVREMI